MKKISHLSLVALLFSFNQVQADQTCPPYEQIKKVHFLQAYPHKNDSNLWYLLSGPFEHNGRSWSVSFAMFIYDEINATQILSIGQTFFNQAYLKRKYPTPLNIPTGLFCDYMSEGSPYLIEAVSPPQPFM